MSRIYTYYQDIPQLPAYDELKLIQLWRQRWKEHGFEPYVLSEWDARKHPHFDEYAASFAKLPSINPDGYDQACYYRWLAVAATGDLYPVMADYDLMPLRLTEAVKAKLTLIQSAMQFHQGAVPSLVCGPVAAFMVVTNFFARAGQTGKFRRREINGRPHTSDMLLLEEFLSSQPSPIGFTVLNTVKQYLEDGWKDAACVHYANASMVPDGKVPRWKHIQNLR